MNGFVDLHGESITGVINTFDRVIFKGHLNGFFPDGAFGRYLSRRGILLKDAGRFFEAETRRIRDHVVSLAAAAGRPVEYLAGASTHRSGSSKEARAREIAERDGVTEGLVCVLSVVEPCRSFVVTPNRQTRRLEVVRRRRNRSDMVPDPLRLGLEEPAGVLERNTPSRCPLKITRSNVLIVPEIDRPCSSRKLFMATLRPSRWFTCSSGWRSCLRKSNPGRNGVAAFGCGRRLRYGIRSCRPPSRNQAWPVCIL